MLAYLRGKYSFKSPAQIYMDVQGVGYEVNISLNTYSAIQTLEEGKLYTYLQIKEDAHTIYGFYEKVEKDTFVLLISVSGVGAATARMMLSSLKSEEVQQAIVTGNIKLLESIKGIGKKTAERIVLELKDKFNKQGMSTVSGFVTLNTLEQDALTALMALGIAKNQSELTMQKVMRAEPGITNLEELIKKVLKAI